MTDQGIPIILTADRILMADYATLLDGMMAAAQTTSVPAVMMRHLLAPPLRGTGLSAPKAPLGLRLLEAALLRDGVARAQVAIVAPENLPRAIGAQTRIVLVSSGDPLGLGMNDSTMSGIGGGRPYTPLWLSRMLAQIAALRAGRTFKVVFGGPGAWQLLQQPQKRAALPLDCVVSGFGEQSVVKIVREALAGRPLPEVWTAEATASVTEIPLLSGPSSMGVVEISRGCGLGCPFCTMQSQPMLHLPADKIVADVRTNLRGGVRSVSLISEDFLRYGAQGMQLAPQALIELLKAVRRLDGLKLIQFDHVNVSSIARFPDQALGEVHALAVNGSRHEYLWVNVGIESASGELLEMNACRGKLAPYRAGEWENVCAQAVDKLLAAGFTPMLSLILGLSGETPAHVRQTREFVRRLAGKRLVIFPLFNAPLTAAQSATRAADLTAEHWALLRECYRFNFKWMPKMIWDNHSGAGVKWPKRVAVQAGGWMQMQTWRAILAWKAKCSRRL